MFGSPRSCVTWLSRRAAPGLAQEADVSSQPRDWRRTTVPIGIAERPLLHATQTPPWCELGACLHTDVTPWQPKVWIRGTLCFAQTTRGSLRFSEAFWVCFLSCVASSGQHEQCRLGFCVPSLLLWWWHQRSPVLRCLTRCLGFSFLVVTAMLTSLAEPWETCCMSAHETASHHSHRGRVCLGAGVLHLQSRCCDCTTKHRAFYASCLCLQRKKCFHCVNQAMANAGYCFVYVFMSLSIYVSSATSCLLENAWVYTLPH